MTNGIQGVALAFEPGEGDTVRRRPRDPGAPIFNRLMIERILIAVLVMGGGSRDRSGARRVRAGAEDH